MLCGFGVASRGMYFRDLTAYKFFRGGRPALNFGWLDKTHKFPVREVSAAASAALVELCAHPVNRTRGCHPCPICESGAPYPTREVLSNGAEHVLGSAEIRVVGEERIYAAPDMVVHYVKCHGYSPPPAVLELLESVPVPVLLSRQAELDEH